MVKKLPKGSTQYYIDELNSLKFNVWIFKIVAFCLYFKNFLQNDLLKALLNHYPQLYLDNPLRHQLLQALFLAIGQRKVRYLPCLFTYPLQFPFVIPLITTFLLRALSTFPSSPFDFVIYIWYKPILILWFRHMDGFGEHTASPKQALKPSESSMSCCWLVCFHFVYFILIILYPCMLNIVLFYKGNQFA